MQRHCRMLTSSVVSAVLVAAVGCHGKAYDSADKTIASMEAVQKELLSGKEQVEKVMESIDGFKAGGDLKIAYDAFEKEVIALDSAAARARSRSEALTAHADEYFELWSQKLEKVQDPELRKSLEERRAEAKKRFDGLREKADEVRNAYEPFTKDLDELKEVLPLDLTPKAIDLLAPKFEKAKTGGKTVIEKVDMMVGEIQKVIDASSSAPAPEPGPAPAPDATSGTAPPPSE